MRARSSLGEPYELPPVVSAHNTYHMWGRELSGRLADGPVIVIGSNRNDLESVFDDVQQVGAECDYCMNWRNDMPIYVPANPSLRPQSSKRHGKASSTTSN